jgi:hypothetical protein
VTRQSAILIGVCVLVLAAAWLGSRSLTADDGAPGPMPTLTGATPVPAPPEPRAPMVVPPPQPTLIAPAGAGELKERALAARGVVVPTHPAEPAPDAVMEEPSPFIGESRELDYADRLMWEPDAGDERLKSAREVYARCLEAVPGLARCKDGLDAANRRLTPQKGLPSEIVTTPTAGTLNGAGAKDLRIKRAP